MGCADGQVTDTFLERKPCALCGGEQVRPVYTFEAGHYPHDRFETACWDGRQNVELRIARCVECGLVFTHPSFTADHLGLIYPGDLVSDEREEEQLDRLFQPHQKFVEMVELLGGYLSPGATLLDVGSRYGVLPWLAEQRLGLRAFGLELNAASVRLGRRRFAGLVCGSIDQLPAIARREAWTSLDAIVLDDVLEHLVHPLRDLRILAGLQRPGDLLVARQMDWSGLGHRLYGERWYYLQPAAHMYYFDESSVRRLLRQAGYEVVEVRRASVALNLLRTLIFEVPRRISRRIRQRHQRKVMCLERRKKAWDDRFAVVARRVAVA